jgi:rsbT antagonist protein RsbS
MARRIPIIKLYRTLIVSVQIELSDELVLELKDDLAEEIRARDVDGLIIEVSGVDILDSYIARSIRDIAQLGRLMGVRTVLVGLDPGMATTLVEMGMVMRNVETALNLETAIELFGAAVGRRRAREDIDDTLLWGSDDSREEP